MRKIALTKGFVTQVDDKDFDFLNQWKWYVYIDRKYIYAIRKDQKTGKRIRMHRVILNAPDGILVDHKDHDGLDNRRNNIRLCTNSQNQANKYGKRKEFKGVYKEWNHFRARIKFNNKNIHIGNFKTNIEAAKAYDNKAKELFGEFALLNFR